jgi:hypothetical protein
MVRRGALDVFVANANCLAASRYLPGKQMTSCVGVLRVFLVTREVGRVYALLAAHAHFYSYRLPLRPRPVARAELLVLCPSTGQSPPYHSPLILSPGIAPRRCPTKLDHSVVLHAARFASCAATFRPQRDPLRKLIFLSQAIPPNHRLCRRNNPLLSFILQRATALRSGDVKSPLLSCSSPPAPAAPS